MNLEIPSACERLINELESYFEAEETLMPRAHCWHAPSHMYQAPSYPSQTGKHIVSVNLKFPFHEFFHFSIFIRCRESQVFQKRTILHASLM